MPSPMFSRALAECVGTFILVSAVTDATIGGSNMGPLCVAAALMVAVYGFGKVSGGHLNPAVSFGVLIMAQVNHTSFSCLEFVVYAGSQVIGALLGVLANVFIWNNHLGGAATTNFGAGSELALKGNMTYVLDGHLMGSNYTNAGAQAGGLLSIGIAETIYTALLVFVVLSVATCGDEGEGYVNNYFGLAIGFVIVAAASAIGSISTCALNPAVAFAVGVLDYSFNKPESTPGYSDQWPLLMILYYTFVELLGAVFACVFFMICRKHQLTYTYGAKGSAPAMLSKLMSEFLGTFTLCLTVLLVVHAPASPAGALGIAASLMVSIYAHGPVSGGHLNPAVSFGLLCVKAIDFAEFILYVAAQVFGSLFALLAAWCILRRMDVALVAKDLPADSGKFGAAQGTWGGIVVAELIFTFILVLTVLNVAVRDTPNQYFGLAIGFVVVVGAHAVGAVSGGCFNPAVAIALDFGGLIGVDQGQFGWSGLYLLVHIVAGGLAAAVFTAVSQVSDEDESFTALEEGEDEDYEDEE